MYSQNDGIAISRPLGPTLANIFIGLIGRKVISKYKVTYFRYVDDCFVLGKMRKRLINFLVCLTKLIHQLHLQ